MLILFDIDGTLLATDGAGVASMTAAGRELFGDHFTLEPIEVSGRLDPLIWADAAGYNNIDQSDAAHGRFREEYLRLLKEHFHNHRSARLMPGVRELTDQLSTFDDVTLGLLTGNYPETGRLKLTSAGLDPDRFPVCAWGDQGSQRRHLPIVARASYARVTSRDISPEQIVIIGDTPHDIDCARYNGCRSLGVATGRFSIDDLQACDADRTLEDLSDTAGLIDWLLKPANASAK